MTNAYDSIILLLYISYIALRVVAKLKYGEIQSPAMEASTDVLVVALILSYISVLKLFSLHTNVGRLHFTIVRMIGDISKWLLVMMLLIIGFQFGFIALSNPPRNAPFHYEPFRSFPITFFTIIGDWYTGAQSLQGNTFGLVLLPVYVFIANILMVSLLVVMMVDSFGRVKAEADEDCKFNRCVVVCEYLDKSAFPPPLNMALWPLKCFILWIWPTAKKPNVRKFTTTEEQQAKIMMRRLIQNMH